VRDARAEEASISNAGAHEGLSLKREVRCRFITASDTERGSTVGEGFVVERHHLDRVGVCRAGYAKRLAVVGFEFGSVASRDRERLTLGRLGEPIVIGGGVENRDGTAILRRHEVPHELPRPHDVIEALDRLIRRNGRDIASVGIVLRKGGQGHEGCRSGNKSDAARN